MMANSKVENANILDPQRFQIAKNMSVMPGGPENNNPDVVIQSNGEQIRGQSIYRDFAQNYPQMGTATVNPQMVQPSMQPALSQQPQPSPNMQEQAEGMRLAQKPMNDGLNANPFMGLAGSPALIPGALDPTLPNNVPFLQATASVDNGAMVPGSTPQKTNKKGKRTA